MNELSESAMKINEYLKVNGQKTQKELIEELNIKPKTVRYAVRRLMDRKMIKSFPNLMDVRSVFYVTIEQGGILR